MVRHSERDKKTNRNFDTLTCTMNMHTHLQSIPNLLQPFPMIFVEGGGFDMGDEHGDLWEACVPAHPVTVSSLYVGQFPVTQALWRAVALVNIEETALHHSSLQKSGLFNWFKEGVVSASSPKIKPTPSRFQGDDRPVEQVSWDDAQAFIQKLNLVTQLSRPEGYHYRLPNEAEWEYVARGGHFHSEGYQYSGSDRLKDVGWFKENSDKETKPVGLKYPNQLGIYDMSGNVWEWCEDWYEGSAYYEACKKKGTVTNPKGPKQGTNRVVRGGNWLYAVPFCRVAYRYLHGPEYRGNYLGFRLVLALQSVGRSIAAFP